MTILPVVISVAEDQNATDDKYTVTIRLRDDVTGKFVGGSYQVQADTKEEMKNKIRPRLAAFLADQARQAQLRDIAQAAIDELITELGM